MRRRIHNKNSSRADWFIRRIVHEKTSTYGLQEVYLKVQLKLVSCRFSKRKCTECTKVLYCAQQIQEMLFTTQNKQTQLSSS